MVDIPIIVAAEFGFDQPSSNYFFALDPLTKIELPRIVDSGDLLWETFESPLFRGHPLLEEVA